MTLPLRLIRFGLALTFLWFGLLKLLRLGPAEPLIAATFPILPPVPVVLFLGVWEVVIGGTLVFRRTARFAAILLLAHLPGTFLSFVTASERCFSAPFVLTTEGEFVLKNVVLIGAGLLLLRAHSREQSGPEITG